MKESSDERLMKWIRSHSELDCYISVLSIGEIQAGISKLNVEKQEESHKKQIFQSWLRGELIPRFQNRILGIDRMTASIWGQIRGEALKNRSTLSVIDALIAATAIQHQLILVTDNTKDFVHIPVHVFNPYKT
jgi:hypothetical protein